MNNPALDLITEYNTKALETLTTLGELNAATIESLINKQVALSTNLFETSVASSKELSAVKSPAEAVEISKKLMTTVADSLKGFVTESTENTLQARESLKAVIDESYALNSEYSVKAYDASVETVNASVETVKASVETVKANVESVTAAPAAAPAKKTTKKAAK